MNAAFAASATLFHWELIYDTLRDVAFLQQWMRRPQNVWLRKALFQVHLWTGIGVGLYVVAICLSGSVLIFRAELSKYFTRGPRTVAISGTRLTNDEIGKAAQQDYPKYSVSHVWETKNPNEAVEVWLDNSGTEVRREFDPYTGADLGRRQPVALDLLSWLVVFHGNLGFGPAGHTANGVGGFLLTVLCATGLVIWWPGMANWRRSLLAVWRRDWKRFNWDLHSAVGFWMLLFVFMFGITGAYLVFTTPFERAINVIAPLRARLLDIVDVAPPDDGPEPQVRVIGPDTNAFPQRGGPPSFSIGDQMVRWAPRLHYGRFAGWKVQALWVLLGLMPPLLFLTGALMWWNRVLRPLMRRARKKARIASGAESLELQEAGSHLGRTASK